MNYYHYRLIQLIIKYNIRNGVNIIVNLGVSVSFKVGRELETVWGEVHATRAPLLYKRAGGGVSPSHGKSFLKHEHHLEAI